MKRFENKVAVVTGGTSGIGLATAKRLHEEGARLAIVGRNAQTLEEAARTIGDGVLAVQADVAQLSEIDRLYRTVTQELGRIDVLFVNAGVGKFTALIDTSESLYDELFAINTKGAYFTLTKAIPSLNDGASIILIALAPITPPGGGTGRAPTVQPKRRYEPWHRRRQLNWLHEIGRASCRER